MNVEDLQGLYDQSQGDDSPSTSTICGECNPTEANTCSDHNCQCTGTRASTARRQSSRSAAAATEKASKPKPKKKDAADTKATTAATSKSKKKKNTTAVSKPKEAATKSKKKASKKKAVSSCLYLYLPLFAKRSKYTLTSLSTQSYQLCRQPIPSLL